MKMEAILKFGPNQETTEAVGNLIREIIHAPCGDTVKTAALEAMQKTLSVSNNTISGSNFDASNTTHNHYAEPKEDFDTEYDEGEEA